MGLVGKGNSNNICNARLFKSVEDCDAQVLGLHKSRAGYYGIADSKRAIR